MATVDELWNLAHDLYVRARASVDPSTKQMLLKAADDYLRQAADMRHERIIKPAEIPKSDSWGWKTEGK